MVLAELRRAPSVTRVKLSGLDQDDVRDLVEVAAGRRLGASGVALARMVSAETAGNPLFVGEVLRHLTETGALVAEDGGWPTEADLLGVDIPQGVREVIGRRLSRLEPDTEEALRAAAVIGLEFDLGLLAAVLDQPEGDQLDLVEQAVTAALVTEVGIDRFRFAHALVRDTLHVELSASRRTRVHRRVAEAIEERNAGDLDRVSSELAMHWGEACAGGDPTAAIDWAERAGEHDLTRRAPDEAARWFTRALDLLDDGHGDHERRRHLLARLAEAQIRADDPAAGRTANASARLAIEAGDVDTASQILSLSTRREYNESTVRDEDRIGLLEDLLALVDPDRAELRGRLLAQLAGELVSVGDFERRDPIVDELLRLMEVIDDPVARWGLMDGGTVAPGQRWGDRAAMEKVRDWCREALAHLQDPFDRVRVYEALWPVLLTLGDRQGCDQLVASLALEEAPTARFGLLAWSFCEAYLDGRLDDVRRHTRALNEYLESVQSPVAFHYWYMGEFVLRREEGGMGELQALAGQRGGPARTTPRFIFDLSRAVNRVLAGDQQGMSVERLDPARISDATDRPGHLTWLAEVAAAVGDERLVEQTLELVEPFHGMHFAITALYFDSADRLIARLHDRLGDHDRADEAFARAVEAIEALRSPVWRARVELDWAESLARRGLNEVAASHVQEARTAIGDLPLTVSRARADLIGARLG